MTTISFPSYAMSSETLFVQNLLKSGELGFRQFGETTFERYEKKKLLSEWPIPRPKDYLSFVNIPQPKEEEENIQYLSSGKAVWHRCVGCKNDYQIRT